MRTINRKPLFVAFFAAMLLLCAGCNDGRAAPTPASGKAAEGHDTAIPSEITEDVETPAVTIGDIAEDIASETVLCHLCFNGYIDDNSFSLLVDDVEWIDCEDAELIEKYQLEDAFFFNDYELYNADPTYELMIALLDGKTRFYLIDWADDLMPHAEVSAAAFIETVSQEDSHLFDVVLANGYITEIRELYVP